jgi:hypothetical protein
MTPAEQAAGTQQPNCAAAEAEAPAAAAAIAAASAKVSSGCPYHSSMTLQPGVCSNCNSNWLNTALAGLYSARCANRLSALLSVLVCVCCCSWCPLSPAS